MNVTLVNPPYIFWKPETQYLERLLGHQPPLGLLSLASYARLHLRDVRLTVLDAAAQALSEAETVERIQATAPEVVGITLTTMVYPAGRTIASRLKKEIPACRIVVGGPHVSGAGETALKEATAFDIGVFGEGEQTFVDVLNMIRLGGSPETIPGVLYRDADGNVRRTADRPLIEKIDSLPFPAWDLLAEFPKAYAPNLFFSPGQPAATLISSRGCPFQCAFCDQSTFGHRYRAAPAQYVYDAVVQLQENYGIRYLIFCDDTFTLERTRMFEFCEALGDLKRPIAWSCDANVNTIDRDMLRAMKRAGCWALSYGLESGSELVLKSLRKAINPGRAREVVRMTAEEGLYAKGLFILGTPEESAETVRQTRHYLRSIPLNSMNLSKFTPYPGSELFTLLADKLDIRYEQLNGMTFVLPSNHLSIEQLEVEYYLTIKHFYKSFRSMRFHVPMLFGHWGNIQRLLGVVPAFVGSKLGPKNGIRKGET